MLYKYWLSSTHKKSFTTHHSTINFVGLQIVERHNCCVTLFVSLAFTLRFFIYGVVDNSSDKMWLEVTIKLHSSWRLLKVCMQARAEYEAKKMKHEQNIVSVCQHTQFVCITYPNSTLPSWFSLLFILRLL